MSSISHNIPGAFKCVLNFDLDATLFEATFEKQEVGISTIPYSELSCRAQLDLSRDEDGVIYYPLLRKVSYEERSFYRVTAFAREKFREIFDKAAQLNNEAKETVVFLNILTNANYTEPEIIKILKRFYGDNFEIHTFTNRERAYGTKGEQMFFDYLAKYNRLGIPKDHIYLVDDCEVNCHGAELYGFKAVRMKTNWETRMGGDSYGDSKEQIFATLNSIVDVVRSMIFSKTEEEPKTEDGNKTHMEKIKSLFNKVFINN